MTNEDTRTPEPRESREVAVVRAEPHESTAVALWGTDNPRRMTARMGEVADAIRDVIADRGLFKNISGRDYVVVEGWSMTGAMIGVFPHTREVEVVETGHLDALRVERQGRNGPYWKDFPEFDGVIAYRATVDLVTRDGGVVGGAIAICSRREEQWRDREDNQLASMAQTRATAKAFRMTLGFVMPMAGYQSTPAEEMTEGVRAPDPSASEGAPRQASQRPQGRAQGSPQRGRASQDRDPRLGRFRDLGDFMAQSTGKFQFKASDVFGAFGAGRASEILDHVENLDAAWGRLEVIARDLNEIAQGDVAEGEYREADDEPASEPAGIEAMAAEVKARRDAEAERAEQTRLGE